MTLRYASQIIVLLCIDDSNFSSQSGRTLMSLAGADQACQRTFS